NFLKRVEYLKSFAKGAPENPRVQEQYDSLKETPDSEIQGAYIIAGLRTVIEGLGISMRGWSLDFGGKGYLYNSGYLDITSLEQPLIDELLTGQDDVSLKEMYKPYNNDSTNEHQAHVAPLETICGMLQAKSLKELAPSLLF